MFITRENGKIVGKYNVEQFEGQEYLPDDALELNPPSEFHVWNNGWQFSDELKRASLKPLSARQVRLILTQFGYRNQVENAISLATQDVKDEWNYANEFERASPVLNGMAQMLGLTESDVDLMFEIGINL